ncbi:MAG: hypothetical protein WD472_11050 [Dehalococcoidia bacterium]
MAVWVAESTANPIKVIELSVATFDTPSLATHDNPDDKIAKAIVRVAGEGASLSELPDGVRRISWAAGAVHFTSLYRQVRQAAIECFAVSDETVDPTSALNGLHGQIAERLPVIPDQPAITPGVRQAAFGLSVGVAAYVAMGLITSQLDQQDMRTPMVFAAIAAWFAWGYWARSRGLRRAVEQGDQTGAIRKALTSLGISLPNK